MISIDNPTNWLIDVCPTIAFWCCFTIILLEFRVCQPSSIWFLFSNVILNLNSFLFSLMTFCFFIFCYFWLPLKFISFISFVNNCIVDISRFIRNWLISSSFLIIKWNSSIAIYLINLFWINLILVWCLDINSLILDTSLVVSPGKNSWNSTRIIA